MNIGSDNYTLGRGEVHFATFIKGTRTPAGFRYLGNSPTLNLNFQSQTLDHYNADHGIKVKDESITLQTDYSATLGLDDIQLENLALMFLGTANTVKQEPTSANAVNFPSVILGLTYQMGMSDANPAGLRNLTKETLKVGLTPLVSGKDYKLDAVRGTVTFLTTAKNVKTGDTVVGTVDSTAYSEDRMISGTSAIEGALKYIAYNPTGADVDYLFPYTRLSPNGDFALKGDTWQTLNFKADFLTQTNRAAVYANGAPYTPGV